MEVRHIQDEINIRQVIIESGETYRVTKGWVEDWEPKKGGWLVLVPRGNYQYMTPEEFNREVVADMEAGLK
jgi:hypothetical protein